MAESFPRSDEERFSSPLLAGARRFATCAHEGPRSEEETEVSHPLAVGRLLQDAGFSEDVVAAGLLHDVVEDTSTAPEELRERFGDEVADLVEAMTEDQGIEPYEERKAEHRRRVAAAGRSVAAIYAADKVVNTKGLGSKADAPADKLEHYRRTFLELEQAHPDLPFLARLREELERLAAGR